MKPSIDTSIPDPWPPGGNPWGCISMSKRDGKIQYSNLDGQVIFYFDIGPIANNCSFATFIVKINPLTHNHF